jgi:hypothetical protein
VPTFFVFVYLLEANSLCCADLFYFYLFVVLSFIFYVVLCPCFLFLFGEPADFLFTSVCLLLLSVLRG